MPAQSASILRFFAYFQELCTDTRIPIEDRAACIEGERLNAGHLL
jgi:hypothetical protein